MSKRIINDVGHRPVSERRCRQGTSPPRGSRVRSPSAAVRIRYWCGYGSHARRENREAVFKSLDYLVTPPVITQYAELQDIVGQHLSAAAAGTVTPEQALKDMQAECEQKIDLTK